ncbi:PadR family transcriptional regulator [Vibrio vulnificus]|nr:PadR family transcriptional regulator [Vibrio vulnificus]
MHISNLQLVLMAEVGQQQMTGYDLAKRLPAKGWKASHQQIYRELAKLETFGLLSLEVVLQSGKPDKKLYQLTELGKQKLTEALDVEPSIARIQDETLAHLFLANAYYFEQLEVQLTQAVEIAVRECKTKMQEDRWASLALNRDCERLMAELNWVTNVLNTIKSDEQTKAA